MLFGSLRAEFSGADSAGAAVGVMLGMTDITKLVPSGMSAPRNGPPPARAITDIHRSDGLRPAF